MQDEATTAAEFKAAESTARLGYKSFSGIAAKALAANPPAKAALVIPARNVEDQEIFLTTVEAAYRTALADGLSLATLGKRGYNAASIQAELDNLKAVSQAKADYLTAQQTAELALDRREAA